MAIGNVTGWVSPFSCVHWFIYYLTVNCCIYTYLTLIASPKKSGESTECMEPSAMGCRMRLRSLFGNLWMSQSFLKWWFSNFGHLKIILILKNSLRVHRGSPPWLGNNHQNNHLNNNQFLTPPIWPRKAISCFVPRSVLNGINNSFLRHLGRFIFAFQNKKGIKNKTKNTNG